MPTARGIRTRLREAKHNGVDVSGPENDRYFAEALKRQPAVVVAAWGALKALTPIPRPINAIWREKQMHRLGINRDRSPKHPLYVPYEEGKSPQ